MDLPADDTMTQVDTFGKAKALNANADLDRGYEAALLIQSLEPEYYGDCPIRPDLRLSVPSSVQATVLRKFRAAINVARHPRQARISTPSSIPRS